MTTTVDVLQVLVRARDLLADPSRWTQGSTAKNAGGVAVDPVSPAATCWCAEGALVHATVQHRRAQGDSPRPGPYVCGGYHDPLTNAAFQALTDELQSDADLDELTSWNDRKCREHGDVVALYDEAIARLQGSAS